MSSPSPNPEPETKPRVVPTILPPVPRDQPVVAKVPESTVVFDYIPTLAEFLPRYKGIPGMYYLLVAIQGRTTAEKAGWQPVVNIPTCRIVGPLGSCDVNLYCMGQRVPGLSHQSGKRVYVVDLNIREITGLKEQPEPEPEPKVEPKKATGGAGSGPKS